MSSSREVTKIKPHLFQNLVHKVVSSVFEDVHDGVFPHGIVQRDRPNLADVDPKLPVRTAALDAKSDGEVEGCPVGHGGSAIGAKVVPAPRSLLT